MNAFCEISNALNSQSHLKAQPIYKLVPRGYFWEIVTNMAWKPASARLVRSCHDDVIYMMNGHNQFDFAVHNSAKTHDQCYSAPYRTLPRSLPLVLLTAVRSTFDETVTG